MNTAEAVIEGDARLAIGTITLDATPRLVVSPAAAALIADATRNKGWRDARYDCIQSDVTTYTRMFRDHNPAHQPDYLPYPIVPGLMIKSALPALAPELCTLVLAGYSIRFIGDAIFGIAEVPVGSQLGLRVRSVEEPEVNEAGRISVTIKVIIGFQAPGDTKMRPAAAGPVVLIFNPE